MASVVTRIESEGVDRGTQIASLWLAGLGSVAASMERALARSISSDYPPLRTAGALTGADSPSTISTRVPVAG